MPRPTRVVWTFAISSIALFMAALRNHLVRGGLGARPFLARQGVDIALSKR